VGGPARRPELALRLGFRQIAGIAEDEARWITAAGQRLSRAVEDVWRRAGVGPATLARLAEADAFAALGLSRRDALWAAEALAPGPALPLFAGDIEGEGIVEPAVQCREMTMGEAVVEDYLAMRLTLRAHPMALLRPWLDAA
jgi:DNA polymerase III alpha subunit